MKTKGNGGYQIIDFEGQAPNTLDVDFFGNTITRGKPLWVSNLVVNGETYNGVASIKKTLTHIILVLATIQVVIALSDGATTYENVNENETIVFEDMSEAHTYLKDNNINYIPTILGTYGDVNSCHIGTTFVDTTDLVLYAPDSYQYTDVDEITFIAYNKNLNLIVAKGYLSGH